MKSALALVEFSDCQKTILTDALDEILLPTRDDVKAQPSLEEVQEAILTSPGPVTTARSFKQGVPRHYRSTTSAEFSKATEGMLDYGTVLGIRVPRRTSKVQVFCKKSPDVLQERWPSDAPCSFQSYSGAFKKNLPTAISDYMKIELNKKGFL
ncbi:hypothetical protein HOLleu_26294 [Holothuria leucospilota]|uniref:Uncharacterized protein n=1 Tax=Holothuria leucospilota TaxID=206669 RepID=A0A9Q1H2E6_HOLLE|nr:hypothetical protein HOLleu_26294 [Holothuria leucospilota]